jgi:thiol-disulfide isomerase/thioredoxin
MMGAAAGTDADARAPLHAARCAGPRAPIRARALVLARAAVFAALAGLGATAHALGIPAAYAPIVIEPAEMDGKGRDKVGDKPGDAAAGRVEFDLTAALARAQRENKRLYVYLGASDCPYCRRYEAFLDKNAAELVPHFKPYLVVDLRSSLSTQAARLFIRVGPRSLPYAEFQRSINDERARMLVYPSVWLFDPQLKPLMQMPAGTGTFQTVPEQLEILQLVQ